MNWSMNLGVKAEASLRKGYQWPYKMDKVKLDKTVLWPKDLLTAYSWLESGKMTWTLESLRQSII